MKTVSAQSLVDIRADFYSTYPILYALRTLQYTIPESCQIVRTHGRPGASPGYNCPNDISFSSYRMTQAECRQVLPPEHSLKNPLLSFNYISATCAIWHCSI